MQSGDTKYGHFWSVLYEALSQHPPWQSWFHTAPYDHKLCHVCAVLTPYWSLWPYNVMFVKSWFHTAPCDHNYDVILGSPDSIPLEPHVYTCTRMWPMLRCYHMALHRCRLTVPYMYGNVCDQCYDVITWRCIVVDILTGLVVPYNMWP